MSLVGRIAHAALKLLAVAWALPYTLLGLLVGLVGLATGGGVRLQAGAIEFHDGAVKAFLRRMPQGEFTLAMTLGHVILGRTAAALDLSCEHERVHVRQYERWGPLFGPAYLLCSFALWLGRGDPYRDNPFEKEAYALDGDEIGDQFST